MAKHISELLNSFVSTQESWKISLLQNWGNIIGNLGDKVGIEKIDKNLLVLKVCHPAWAQEIFLLYDTLKQKINAFLGGEFIHQIRFKFGDIQQKKKSKKYEIKNNLKNPISKSLKDVFLTEDEKKELSKIVDKELQEWLEKFYLCCKRESGKKWKREKKIY